MKKKVLLALQLLCSLALLAWVASLAPAGSWTALAAAPLHYIALATIAMVVNLALGAFRLYRLLQGTLPGAHFSLILKGTWLGYFCSSFLPSSVGGDVVKLAWLANKLGHGATILAGMVVERVLNLGITVVMACVFLMPYASRQGYAFAPEPGTLGTLWLPALGIAGLALCCAVGVWAARSRHRYAALLRGHAGQVREALRFWRQAPRSLLEVIFWSMGMAVVAGLGVLLPTAWTTGADISVPQAIGCAAAATLLTLIPVTINGIGVYEAGLVGLLTMVGVPEACAAQTAIFLRLVLIIAAIPGACWVRFGQADSKKGSGAV